VPLQDPIQNFRFRVKWDGRYVAGVSRVSPLKRSTEVTSVREGGDPTNIHKAPGKTAYDPIILERGITGDPDFEDWANVVSTLSASGNSVANFRKDIVIDIFNEAGHKVLSYFVHRCWVSEYQALPLLDASANMVAIEHIKLENEGWERDRAIVPPPHE
jgi:phage tail-like protein